MSKENLCRRNTMQKRKYESDNAKKEKYYYEKLQ